MLTMFSEHVWAKLTPFNRKSVTEVRSFIHGVNTLKRIYHPAAKPATKKAMNMRIKNHNIAHRKFPPVPAPIYETVILLLLHKNKSETIPNAERPGFRKCHKQPDVKIETYKVTRYIRRESSVCASCDYIGSMSVAQQNEEVKPEKVTGQKKKKRGRAPHIGTALIPDVSFAAVPQSPCLLINYGSTTFEHQNEKTESSRSHELTSFIEEQDEDPGYSTIQELSRECGSSLSPFPPCLPSPSQILPHKLVEEELTSEPRSCPSSLPATSPQNLEDLYAKPRKKFLRNTSANTETSENTSLRDQVNRCVEPHEIDIHASTSTGNTHLNNVIDRGEKEDILNTQVNQLETWKQMKHKNNVSNGPPKSTRGFCQKGSMKHNSPIERGINNEEPKEMSVNSTVLNERISCLQNCIRELIAELNQYLCSKHRVVAESVASSWQDEVKSLQQRVREIVEENRELQRQKNADWMKEWENKNLQVTHLLEENNLLRDENQQLKENLMQCEFTNKREMESLAAELASLQVEKVRVTGEINRMQEKHCALQRHYHQLSREKENVVPQQRYLSSIQESHRLLEELKRKYREELDKVWDEVRTRDERNHQLLDQLSTLKRNMEILQQEKSAVQEAHQLTVKKCDNLSSQLQESQLQKTQVQGLLSSLLHVAEQVTSERDIAVKKSQGEEERNQQLITSFLEHSLVVGRLQEHIKNFKMKTMGDLEKVQARVQEKDTNWEIMKQEYERELCSLRNAVIQKQAALLSMQDEKRHLELDLETLLQVCCEDTKTMKHKMQLLTV